MVFDYSGICMDEQSKIAKNAEAYIRYTTKQEVKQRELKVDEHGRICVDSHKSIKVDHEALANNFLKLSGVCPGIPVIGRKIIQTRLMNPGISTEGIGLAMGLRNDEVLAFERDGINRIKQFIGSTSFQEANEKASRDKLVDDTVKNLNLQGKNNSLLTPQTP